MERTVRNGGNLTYIAHNTIFRLCNIMEQAGKKDFTASELVVSPGVTQRTTNSFTINVEFLIMIFIAHLRLTVYRSVPESYYDLARVFRFPLDQGKGIFDIRKIKFM